MKGLSKHNIKTLIAISFSFFLIILFSQGCEEGRATQALTVNVENARFIGLTGTAQLTQAQILYAR